MADRFDLTGRTALVTGASSGFGREFARVLASAGARVVVGARRVRRLETLCEEIRAAGGEALPVELDVTDDASRVAAFEAAEREFAPVGILVNNAGVASSEWLLEAGAASWDRVLDTNLKAVWQVGAEAARRMREHDVPGSIVNVASVLAFGTGKKLGVYMTSKAGVVQLTRAMALEWARFGIRVNALAPGFFPTAMSAGYIATPEGREMLERIPQRRAGDIDELAGPLLLLASDAGSYMTGSVVTVDGGHLCSQL